MFTSKVSDPKVIRAALEVVVGSRIFARADRQARLLRHIVEKTASGESGEIKEYSIALEVFGRASYDPKVDSLVRVEVSQLRQRLATYYQTEGRDDRVRIEIPKGGYVPVVVAEPQVAVASPRHRLKWAGVAACAAMALAVAAWRLGVEPAAPRPPLTPSVAVLPFLDLSPAKDLAGFGDGLTEEVIHHLAGVQGLRVASRTSVFEYRNRDRDVRRIGEALEVLTVLEGSVRRDGQRVRVTAQLIRSEDGFHLWTETWDRDLTAALQVQSEVAARIAKLSPIGMSASRRALARQGTRNAEAWHYYLRAVQSADEPDLAKAVEFYRAAIAADPGYALAWAALSQTLLQQADWGEARPADVVPEAAEAARRAVDLDPALSEAHQAAGRVMVLQQRDWRGAGRKFRRAIELDPTHVEARYDYARLVLNLTGRFQEAADQLERAIVLVPSLNALRNERANSQIGLGQYDRANESLAVSLKLAPRAPATWIFKGMAAARQGDHALALECFERAAALRRSAWVLGHVGHALARLGRREETEKVIAEIGIHFGKQPEHSYHVAVLHAVLGRKDQAFQSLHQAYDNGSPFLLSLNIDYRLDDLRGDSRFKDLVRKLRFK